MKTPVSAKAKDVAFNNACKLGAICTVSGFLLGMGTMFSATYPVRGRLPVAEIVEDGYFNIPGSIVELYDRDGDGREEPYLVVPRASQGGTIVREYPLLAGEGGWPVLGEPTVRPGR